MKTKYKTIFRYLAILLISVGMIRCNESEDLLETGAEIQFRDSLPTGTYDVAVSNITVTSGQRSLQVSWEAPEDISLLSHYLVRWQGQLTDTTLYTMPVTTTSYEITHLYNDNYTISIVAVATTLQRSAPVEAGQFYAPLEDNEGPAAVTSLEATPVATSAVLNWVNPDDTDFEYTVVKIRHTDSIHWSVTDTLSGIATTLSVVGLREATEYAYHVQTFDYLGNPSDAIEGTFRTQREVLLDKLDAGGNPLWNIIDFSSQETGGDDGRASNVLDGDDNTFWHSVWNSGDYGDGSNTGTLPQYIVVDLNQEIIPTVIMLYRRNGAGTGPTSVRVESVLEAPLSRDTEWNDLGTYAVDGGNENGALSCNLTVLEAARYLRITVLAAASGNYAIVREINVRALVSGEE